MKEEKQINLTDVPKEITCVVYYPDGTEVAHCYDEVTFDWIRLEVIKKKINGIYFITNTNARGTLDVNGDIKMDNFYETPFIKHCQISSEILKETFNYGRREKL